MLHQTATKMNIVTNKNNTTSNTTRATTSSLGSTSNLPACAACKYQRRRCAPNCLLAPFFPAEKAKDFLNAHKLFGVSNMLKVLKNVRPFERETAMKSMIFAANVRANDPVGGCYRIIDSLQRQINYFKAELDLVLHQLDFYRAHSAQQEMQNLDIAADINGNGTISMDLLSVYDPIHAQVIPVKVDIMESKDNMKTLVDESGDIKPFVSVYDEKQSVLFASQKLHPN